MFFERGLKMSIIINILHISRYWAMCNWFEDHWNKLNEKWNSFTKCNSFRFRLKEIFSSKFLHNGENLHKRMIIMHKQFHSHCFLSPPQHRHTQFPTHLHFPSDCEATWGASSHHCKSFIIFHIFEQHSFNIFMFM